MSTVSPTANRSFFAVPASIATWSGPAGHSPVLSFSGLKRAFAGSMLVPRLSCPTALPSDPMMSAPLTSAGLTVPLAASTSGSARTSSSSDSGMVAEPLVEVSTICLPPMTASVSSYDAANRPSNVRCIVSVRMKVPLTIETPMTTAKAVSRARTLRPARPLRATAIIVR